jgi:hypothetical protein
MLPVSNDTLLRVVRRRTAMPTDPLHRRMFIGRGCLASCTRAAWAQGVTKALMARANQRHSALAAISPTAAAS